MFDGIVGNERIKRYLQRVIEGGTVGNSLLFSGPEGVGKALFAKELAATVVSGNDPSSGHARKAASGNHPDIRYYRPEGKTGMHSIESMRQFSEDVYLRPYEAPWKVFIIDDAHRMLPYSANALLKTFEEPASDSIIILITSAMELLLPTVLSRCRTLHFNRVDEQEISRLLIDKYHCPADEARRYAALSQGSVGEALRLKEMEGKDTLRTAVLDFLAKGRVDTYFELTDFVKQISSHVDAEKKGVENEVREQLLHGVKESDLSAKQKQIITKEVEGAIAMRLAHDARNILDLILFWFRDLHLLYLGGDNRYLVHKDYESEMQAKIISAEPPPLEYVQKTVADARLSLQRSTSLSICLENLFLKLNFL